MFEPVEKSGFEDAAAAIEGVAGEPDEFGLEEVELFGVVELCAEFGGVDPVAEADFRGAVGEGEGGAGLGKALPDELEHQKLVEIGVEQGAGDGVQLPVVVVGAAR